MKLTGKCKEDFERWLSNRWMDEGLIMPFITHPHLLVDVSKIFNDLPDSMKWGVYQDYFDSVGIEVNAERGYDLVYSVYNDSYEWFVDLYESDASQVGFTKTRPEARTKAIEKANEIRNKHKYKG